VRKSAKDNPLTREYYSRERREKSERKREKERKLISFSPRGRMTTRDDDEEKSKKKRAPVVLLLLDDVDYLSWASFLLLFCPT